jgi:nucleoside-diphosphate-sugar epimerase
LPAKKYEDMKMNVTDLNCELPDAYRRELSNEFSIRYTAKGRSPKILLVGGAGYIGSVLTKHLLDCGYFVRVLDLLLYGQGDVLQEYLKSSSFEFMKGDFTDSLTLDRAFEGMTDVVVLAGLVGDPITKKYPEASQAVNVDGMLRLVKALGKRALNKVIFISTCSNYGLIPGDSLADENFELKPLSLYAKAKVAVEQEVLSLKSKADYAATILRFATAFGLSPRMRFDLTVNEFTREATLGGELLVYDAKTWRPYCHVQDLSLLIRRVLEAPRDYVHFEVFNVGGAVNNMTKEMIVNEVKQRVPSLKVRYKEHGTDPRNYKVDFSKIQARLHFEPRYKVADGVEEILAAIRNGLFQDYEERKNFYGNYSIDYTGSQEAVQPGGTVCKL